MVRRRPLIGVLAVLTAAALTAAGLAAPAANAATVANAALSATAYDLPAGSSLTLVIDTVDPLYYDENAFGGSVTIGGGSYVDIPLK